ncbi:hypothetical protein, partial [Hafnia alvei]|uniref:hypothetical protein n=1 Tax=Hafnia alvei TaxID=569 RepID=UPI001D01FD86
AHHAAELLIRMSLLVGCSSQIPHMILPAVLRRAIFELMAFLSYSATRKENHPAIANVQPLPRVTVLMDVE